MKFVQSITYMEISVVKIDVTMDKIFVVYYVLNVHRNFRVIELAWESFKAIGDG